MMFLDGMGHKSNHISAGDGIAHATFRRQSSNMDYKEII